MLVIIGFAHNRMAVRKSTAGLHFGQNAASATIGKLFYHFFCESSGSGEVLPVRVTSGQATDQ